MASTLPQGKPSVAGEILGKFTNLLKKNPVVDNNKTNDALVNDEESPYTNMSTDELKKLLKTEQEKLEEFNQEQNKLDKKKETERLVTYEDGQRDDSGRELPDTVQNKYAVGYTKERWDSEKKLLKENILECKTKIVELEYHIKEGEKSKGGKSRRKKKRTKKSKKSKKSKRKRSRKARK